MKWSAMGIAAVAALVAGAAVGQDGAGQSGTTAKKASPQLSAAAERMSDPDARWAMEQAERARTKARCLQNAAKKLEQRARSLDAAPNGKKLDHLMALLKTQDALELCNEKQDSLRGHQSGDGLKFGPMTVSSPVCEPSDPLCSDIVSPSSAPVVDTVKSRRTDFRLCYEKAQQSHPNLKGSMSLRAMLAEVADGTSAPAKVEIEKDTLNNAELAQCVTKSIRALRFDKGGAGLVIRFAVAMRPGD